MAIVMISILRLDPMTCKLSRITLDLPPNRHTEH